MRADTIDREVNLSATLKNIKMTQYEKLGREVVLVLDNVASR